VTWTRSEALGAPVAFGLLACSLAAVHAIGGGEATWAAAAVAAAFLPSGWLAPATWRRRLAEATLLPAGYALAMVGDPTMRRMVFVVVLVLGAAAACWASKHSTPRRFHPWLAAAFGLALWAAPGPPPVSVLTMATGGVALAAIAWAGTRLGGIAAGIGAALLVSALALPTHPTVALAVGAGAALLTLRMRDVSLVARVARGWLPASLAFGAAMASLAPWGNLPLKSLFPAAGGLAAASVGAAALATPVLPATLAACAWLAATLTLGPVVPPQPEFHALTLSAEHSTAALPSSDGGPYLLDVALSHAAGVPQGTPVATARGSGGSLVLRAGVNTAEWSWRRPDVRAHVEHGLPEHPLWRPSGSGRTALWGVSGRTVVTLPAGVQPQIARDPALPPRVDVIVAAGTPRATPPRDWPLPTWLAATAAVVALVQLGAGTWRSASAALPWALLTLGSVAARVPVAPLRLLGERHAVDLAMAALLAAWVPAAIVWLKARRVFLAGAMLLVPLALATPHLTPPLWGDEPYHLQILDSLVRYHTFDVSAHYPPAKPGSPLQSPALAFMLLPFYVAGGRGGALAALALAAAGVAALVHRRAARLGLGVHRRAVLALLLLLTYPLATFATQIWVEVIGALALAASLVLIARPTRGRGAVTAIAAVAAAVKTRLGLVTFPLAVAAWWPARRSRRTVALALTALAAVVAVGIGGSLLLYGHPLGSRGFADLVPHSLRQTAIGLGGLAFDPAGGLMFAAPLLLAALAGTAMLWRRGGRGEKAMLLGGLATVLALLPSSEWYGGGAPPGRYLVPLLPAFALAGACLLAAPQRTRRLALVLLPPSLLAWWVLVTRPHLSINGGNGGWWFADALARRFAADGRHLFPSFLRPSPATLWVPAASIVAAWVLVRWLRRSGALARQLGRQTVALWLVVLAGFVGVVTQRFDRVVELEDPQIKRLGGTIVPPEGTFARYTYPSGWRVANGEGVDVPLHLRANATVRVVGWLDGAAQGGAALRAGWDGTAMETLPVAGSGEGSVEVAAPVEGGRHRLRLVVDAPAGGSAVLERIEVRR
jgi:hypothetical protein